MARILVVDDEEVIRSTVRQILERAGHEVREAADGALALRAFREQGADLVLTDIIMPEMEGVETTVALRKISADVKIIAMSGGGRTRNLDFLKVARKLGADGVLPKPFGMKDLLSAVEQALSSQHDR